MCALVESARLSSLWRTGQNTDAGFEAHISLNMDEIYRNCKYYSSYRLTQEGYPNMPSTTYQALAPIFKTINNECSPHSHFIINTPFGCIITLNIMVLSLYQDTLPVWMHQIRIDKHTRF